MDQFNDIPWKLIDTYFKDNPFALVDHHLVSYNDFFNNGIKQLLKSNKIKSSKGTATLVDPKKVTVETKEGTQEIEAEKIIIATGSVPAKPPFFD